MVDFLKAGLVYVPIYAIGRHVGGLFSDPIFMFAAGWVACGVAITIRIYGPRWIRGQDFIQRS